MIDTAIPSTSTTSPGRPVSVKIEGPDSDLDVYIALLKEGSETGYGWLALEDVRALRDTLTEVLESVEGVKAAPEADAEKPALPPVGDLPLAYAVEVVKAFASAGR